MRMFTLSLFMGIAVVACGGSDESESVDATTAANSEPTARATEAAPESAAPQVVIDGVDVTQDFNPCPLLTPDEVAAALGEAADDGRYEFTPPLHTCVWESPSRRLDLRVWHWGSPAEAESSFADWVGDIREVQDVGDAALISDQVDLAFLSGSIEVGVFLSPDDDPPTDQAAALEIGLLIIDRLP